MTPHDLVLALIGSWDDFTSIEMTAERGVAEEDVRIITKEIQRLNMPIRTKTVMLDLLWECRRRVKAAKQEERKA